MTSNAQPAFTWHANEHHCDGCLSGGGEIRKLATRARQAAHAVVGLRIIYGCCTGGRPHFYVARPWCHMPAVISNAQLAFTWLADECHRADGLSVCCETREVVSRARRAALVAIDLRIMKGYCTGGRPLSSGARP